jgi:hypothetical protein
MNSEVNKRNSETQSRLENINSEIRPLKSRITERVSVRGNADLPKVQEHGQRCSTLCIRVISYCEV